MKESYAIETRHLTKRYGEQVAVNDVCLHVPKGHIYGLLGRNGAGKTSIMKLILQLMPATSGETLLFGEPVKRRERSVFQRIGAIIETPGFYPNLTGTENLEIFAKLRGTIRPDAVEHALQVVGLPYKDKKLFGEYSLGMKQRLGIANAIMHDPELLILDEPINGLDPIGVVEIRKLLSKLCEEKQITILISSHNLPELYQVATDYIIIHQGVIRQKLTLEELDEKCRHHILIGTDQPDRLAEVLESSLKTTNYRVMPDKMIRLYDFLDEKEKVARVIFENGIMVTEYTIQGETLENYFISVIGGGENA